MKEFDDGIFKASVAEKLFEEMYHGMHKFIFIRLIFHFYGKIAEQILSYMYGKIDYNTFKQKVLAIKALPDQKSIDGAMLKDMIKFGKKLVSRYFEIPRS